MKLTHKEKAPPSPTLETTVQAFRELVGYMSTSVTSPVGPAEAVKILAILEGHAPVEEAPAAEEVPADDAAS